jgi:hypothetical protein
MVVIYLGTRAWRQRTIAAVTENCDVSLQRIAGAPLRFAQLCAGTTGPCVMCGNPISTHTGRGRPGRYCSSACRTRAWRQRITATAERRR